MARCKICKTEFQRRSMTHKCCLPACAEIYAKEQTKKQVEKKVRAETKVRKEKLKTLHDWIRDAQTVFNKFIRLRDSGQRCICCDTLPSADRNQIGGSVDAGHYRSRGSAGHLRFSEDNCHAQKKQCNRWDAGNVVGYRIGLIKRIGLERVEALEQNNTPHKWTVDELKGIIEKYKLKIKELEND